MNKPEFKHIATLLHSVLLGAIYSFFALKAFLEFRVDWDFLTYHLPDALARFGLTTYRPERELQELNQAFPPFPHLLQGVLVFLTGQISAAKGISVIAFVLLLLSLSALFREQFSFRWFLTACLALPLFQYHFISGYVDLFQASFLVLGVAAFLKFEVELRNRIISGRTLSLVLVGFSGAMFSKYQAWPIVAVYVAFVALRLGILLLSKRVDRRAEVGIFLILLLLLVTAWPVRNLVLYRNPTYPYRAPLFGSVFVNQKYQAVSLENTPSYMRGRSHTLAFFHSAFELNRLQTREEFLWTHDQAALVVPDSPHHRMGGWFYATMILLSAAFILGAFSRAIPGVLVGAFLVVVAVTSCIPQSHDLRYWFHVPLTLALFVGVSWNQLRKRLRNCFGFLFLVCAGYVLSKTNLFILDRRPISAYAPQQAREFWAEQQRHPTNQVTRICQKMPYTIFWSGPTFNEYLVEGCF